MKRNVAIGTGLLALLVRWAQPERAAAHGRRAGEGRRAGAAVRSRSDVAQAAAQSLGDRQRHRRRRRHQDHVYIIHRGAGSLEPKEIYATTNPPQSECCVPAPPVLEFDAEGNFVRAWGGPGQGFEWPESNHGITPDSKGNLFIGGNGGNDGHILKFTQDGKFVKQFGFSYASAGSNDMFAFNKVAKISLDERPTKAYVLDGYGNHRVAVIDMDTGKIKRYWGAYGNKPDDTPLGNYNPDAPLAQQFRTPVHCAEPSNDGIVYVCDRPERPHPGLHQGRQVREGDAGPEDDARRRLGVGHRVLEGRAQKYFYLATAPTRRSACSIALRSPSSPASATADASPGQFYAVHSIATDSKGNVYTTETYRGSGCRSSSTRVLGPVTEAEPGHRSGRRRRTH
jgi:hypothetical protein